jgi:hypothetical protein
VLAAKRRWQHMRKAAGKPYDKPNLVMNAAVQVCCTFTFFFWSTKWCSYQLILCRGESREVYVVNSREIHSLLTALDTTDLEVEEKYW